MSWIIDLICKKHCHDSYIQNDAIDKLVDLTNMLEEREAQIAVPPVVMKMVSDHLTMAMWCKDNDGKIVFANKPCCDMILNCNEEDAVSRKDTYFVDKAIACVFNEVDEMVNDRNQLIRLIEHARREDGSDIWIASVRSPWISYGELIGITSIAVDITGMVPIEVRDEFAESGYIEFGFDVDLSPTTLMEILESSRR